MTQKISFLMAGLMLVVSASHDVAFADEIKKTNPPGVVSSKVNTDPEATIRYWTPERMHNAKPMEMTIGDKPNLVPPQKETPAEPGVVEGSSFVPPSEE